MNGDLAPEDIARFGPDPQTAFQRNLARVQDRIAAACARAGRSPAEVELLPVTKTVPAHVLRLARAGGITSFAENKIQEAVTKRDALGDLDIDWHIVGHLQTNKVKYLVRFARSFHALDSLRLADALNRRLQAEGRDLDVWVQVNTSGEDSKFGLTPEIRPDTR